MMLYCYNDLIEESVTQLHKQQLLINKSWSISVVISRLLLIKNIIDHFHKQFRSLMNLIFSFHYGWIGNSNSFQQSAHYISHFTCL